MTPGQIIEIVERLEALDERLASIEHAREVDREVAERRATEREETQDKWTRRACIAAVVGPFVTVVGALAALAAHSA